ncbi:MAG: NAD(P)/FAD-dependent oxidoreductase [Hasllibacter sp.]
MEERFDAAVVGAGMWGAACARWLTDEGARVALIGPEGGPSSHDDAARIARRLDPDPVWAALADASMARFDEIGRASGIRFWNPVGALVAAPSEGPLSGRVPRVAAAGAALSRPFERLDHASLRKRYPMVRLPAGTEALWEPEAGWIDPRALVAAQRRLSVRAGAVRIDARAVRVAKGAVGLSDGSEVRAPRVILAAGAWTRGLLPGRDIGLWPVRATALLARADTAPPVLLWEEAETPCGPYILPPIRYPDGHSWLKIGGERSHAPLREAEIGPWFASQGDPDQAGHLLSRLRAVLPDARIGATRSFPCAYAKTRTGHPVIHAAEPWLTVLAGGNGAGAKSSDEIGRLGARAALGEAPEVAGCRFAP